MQNLTEKQQEKYTARNWILTSPEGRYHAIYSCDTAVSLAYMKSHFKGEWKIAPLFPKEQATAKRKVERLNEKQGLK